MEHAQQRLHFTMSFIGGFLAVYAVLCFAGLLGSAQTSNLILLTTDLLSANWMDFLLRIGGAILYMCAIALTVWLPRRCRTDLRRISVVLDMAAALVVGLFPEGIPPVLGLYPLFFAMAFQWNSFTGADGFVSSTIFSTNNFRQFSMALAETPGRARSAAQSRLFRKNTAEFPLRRGHFLPALAVSGQPQRLDLSAALRCRHGTADAGAEALRSRMNAQEKSPRKGAFFILSDCRAPAAQRGDSPRGGRWYAR